MVAIDNVSAISEIVPIAATPAQNTGFILIIPKPNIAAVRLPTIMPINKSNPYNVQYLPSTFGIKLTNTATHPVNAVAINIIIPAGISALVIEVFALSIILATNMNPPTVANNTAANFATSSNSTPARFNAIGPSVIAAAAIPIIIPNSVIPVIAIVISPIFFFIDDTTDNIPRINSNNSAPKPATYNAAVPISPKLVPNRNDSNIGPSVSASADTPTSIARLYADLRLDLHCLPNLAYIVHNANINPSRIAVNSYRYPFSSGYSINIYAPISNNAPLRITSAITYFTCFNTILPTILKNKNGIDTPIINNDNTAVNKNAFSINPGIYINAAPTNIMTPHIMTTDIKFFIASMPFSSNPEDTSFMIPAIANTNKLNVKTNINNLPMSTRLMTIPANKSVSPIIAIDNAIFTNPSLELPAPLFVLLIPLPVDIAPTAAIDAIVLSSFPNNLSASFLSAQKANKNTVIGTIATTPTVANAPAIDIALVVFFIDTANFSICSILLVAILSFLKSKFLFI